MAYFNNAWEQRTLQDVLRVNSGKDYKKLNYGAIPVFGTGGYMLSVDESLSEKDAVGIGRKGTINSPQLLKAPFWTVDTLFFLTPESETSLLFIYSLCQIIPWKKFDESTGVPSLSKNTIEKIKILIPDKNEQSKIGMLFEHTNNLIAANQRQQNKPWKDHPP
ncbi:restriction endonuclease subunit S [Paucilactobacillus wasatchensis]|nr:restriction endonuclease subunit S [Paucilactobacillus wasatchensis]